LLAKIVLPFELYISFEPKACGKRFLGLENREILMAGGFRV
jgi:hypothetical protein